MIAPLAGPQQLVAFTFILTFFGMAAASLFLLLERHQVRRVRDDGRAAIGHGRDRGGTLGGRPAAVLLARDHEGGNGDSGQERTEVLAVQRDGDDGVSQPTRVCLDK